MRYLGALCVGLFVAGPGAARAVTNPCATIGLHLTEHHASQMCGTFEPADVPCSEFETGGAVGRGYDVYVIVGRGDPVAGIAGAALGIAYDGGAGSGVDVIGWQKCADLEFPGQNWPASGGGNALVFAGVDHCQRTEVGADGVHAVLGAFYVYAYGPDDMRVSGRVAAAEPGPKIADCESTETMLPESRAGWARFSVGGAEPGYNPCCAEPECIIPPEWRPPVLLSAWGVAESNRATLQFDEPLGGGAADPGKYRVVYGPAGEYELPVLAAYLGPASVQLEVGGVLTQGVEYTARAIQVPDPDGNIAWGWQSAAFLPTGPRGLAEPKIAVHLGPHAAKNQCTTNAPITLPCEDFTTRGNTGASYDLYVVACDPAEEGSIAGLSFGIRYDGTAGSGVDVYAWTRCADLDFPGQGFPGSGGGNTVTWDPETHCQEGRAGGNAQAVGGWFYVYAYGADRFEIVRRAIATPDIKVADCTAREYEVMFPEHAGSVGFEQEGENPCALIPPVNVEPTTWGAIKRTYGAREKGE